MQNLNAKSLLIGAAGTLVALLMMAPRNGSGTYTLPAGNPVTSGAVISSTVHNATMADIRDELTNSVAKDGQTTMTGDLNLGNNDLVGVNSITPYGTGITVNSQAFVFSSTNPSARWYESDAGSDAKYWAWESNSGTLKLMTKTDAAGTGADVITITRSGTALGALTLSGATGSVAMSSSGALTFTNSPVTGNIGYSVTPTFQIGTSSNHGVDLYSNGTTRMTIRSDGSITTQVFTVAGLPTCSSTGQRAFVSNATATTFASIVAGGGSNAVPVYCDGTNWRIG